MFDARGEFHKLGKGAMLIGLWSGSTPPTYFDFAGNMDSLDKSVDPTVVKKFSNTKAAGALVDSRTIRNEFKMVAKLDEFTVTNLKLWLLGTAVSANQSVQAVADLNIVDIVVGKYYDLGKRRITVDKVYLNEASVNLVEGTDYELDTDSGTFRALPGGGIADLDDVRVHCAVPALTITHIRLAQNASPVARIRFMSDDANSDSSTAKDILDIWKASIAPGGTLSLIGDDYGNFDLEFSVLSDTVNHPLEPFGHLERIGTS